MKSGPSDENGDIAYFAGATNSDFIGRIDRSRHRRGRRGSESGLEWGSAWAWVSGSVWPSGVGVGVGGPDGPLDTTRPNRRLGVGEGPLNGVTDVDGVLIEAQWGPIPCAPGVSRQDV